MVSFNQFVAVDSYSFSRTVANGSIRYPITMYQIKCDFSSYFYFFYGCAMNFALCFSNEVNKRNLPYKNSSCPLQRFNAVYSKFNRPIKYLHVKSQREGNISGLGKRKLIQLSAQSRVPEPGITARRVEVKNMQVQH